MKIAIVGAGAIGGYLAVTLAEAGEEIVVLARDRTLEALRTRGFTLRIGGEEKVRKIRASDDASELGPVDYVILALKANAAPVVAPKLPPLFHDETAVVTAMNGIPFWYFHGLGGEHQSRRLESVDPDGVLSETIGAERCIGCVVYPAASVVEPAVIEHEEGDRFSLGEPDGSRSERVQRLSKAMIAAGLKAPVRPKIRDEIWIKLWGNLSFNPISALTGATLDVICTDQGTRAVARAMMLEGKAVAEKLGVEFRISVDKRIEGAREVGAHKTSMLQDLERRRSLELDALVGAVQEMGRLVDVPTPTIDTVGALVRLRAEVEGCPV